MDFDSCLYSRGACAPSIEEAIQRKLHLPNQSSASAFDRQSPPGSFFSASLRAAEEWAIMAARREGKLPISMQFTLTRNNFPNVLGRLYSARFLEGIGVGLRSMDYVPVRDWSELDQGMVVIEVRRLSADDLIALNAQVGQGKRIGKFKYQSFEELYKRQNP